MKRLINLFIIIMIFLSTSVYAKEKDDLRLFKTDELGSAKMENFSYDNIKYTPVLDNNVNYGVINIGSVTNISKKKLPISIDVLLFDKDKKNIGFVTYCTEQDYSSSYAQLKLASKESAMIDINVTKKYFVDDAKAQDVSYYAVLDDNIYCHVGGYSKYMGLTPEQIQSGDIFVDKTDKKTELIEWFKSIDLTHIIIIVVSVIVSFVICGIVIDSLNKRINAESSMLSFLPITNCYMAFKLSFGDLIAKIFIVGYVLSIILYFINISFFMYLFSIAGGLAFIIVIIKLITKKYDLFVFNPAVSNSVVNSSEDSVINDDSNFLEKIEDKEEKVDNQTDIFKKEEETVDLNYSTPSQDDIFSAESDVNKTNGSKNDDGESDLSKFFN